MRSFIVTMLFAAVIAEDGYTCTDSGSDWVSTDISTGVTTSDECKTACDTTIEDSGASTDNDWCCHATAVADPVSMACDLYSIATADLDIRAEEEAAVEGTTNSAWAWGAGVALDDLTVVEEEVVEEEDDDESAEDDEDDEEDDEDMSVRMTASAVAAASIAMLAM